MLPVTESPCTRAKSVHCLYLPFDSSITQIHAKYCEFLAQTYPGEGPVTEHSYRDVFLKQYNIGIAPPKKDTCTTCDLIDVEIQREKA